MWDVCVVLSYTGWLGKNKSVMWEKGGGRHSAVTPQELEASAGSARSDSGWSAEFRVHKAGDTVRGCISV